ncbi:hypothetical protein [Serratia proteamaculans]|uniref:hypothetical protein n=1 Tax=Serratia proteamaculans TaxID=28151 RepID=UPI00298171CE|nr:hypothetical protein [Serratia proteamaculans]MDW5510243.1 hypothetical protein [Serratia proteamaculans]
MQELTDAVKKTLVDRINTPLFGFIILSWLSFNWSDIATLLLSKKDIQERINSINSTSDLFGHSLLYPILLGYLLSVIFPYAQWTVSYLQRVAQRLLNSNNERMEQQEHNLTKKLAKLRAEAEGALEIEKIEIKNTIADKEIVIAQKRANLVELNDTYSDIQKEISNAESKLIKLKQETINIENEVKDKNPNTIAMNYYKNLDWDESGINAHKKYLTNVNFLLNEIKEMIQGGITQKEKPKAIEILDDIQRGNSIRG